MVEPVEPFQGGELDGFERSPWPPPVDHFGLVKAIDRLGQSIVIAVSDAADRRLDAGFGEAFGLFYRHILRPAIAMVDQAAAMDRSTIVKRLLERIQDRRNGSRRCATCLW